MSIPYIILTILYFAVCVALVVVILLQKKRSSGLGNMSGMANAQTYWDKNKGRSLEGSLEKYTKIGGAVFFIGTVLISLL